MSVWREQLADDAWLVGVSGRLDHVQTPALETKLHLMPERLSVGWKISLEISFDRYPILMKSRRAFEKHANYMPV